MTKSEIEKAARRLVEVIDAEQTGFANWTKKNQADILNAIMSELGDAPTKGGKLDNSESMRKFVAALPKRVRAALLRTGYIKRVDAYARRFDEVQQLQIDLHDKVNGINVAPAISPIKALMVGQTVSNLSGAGMDNIFVAPIQYELLKHATVGNTLRDTVDALRQFVAGSPSAQNTTFTNYALQIGRDAIGQYDGAANQKIAEQFDLNAFVYVGSVVEDTRAQCERWLEKEFILTDELQDEIDWAFNNGTGMIAGTTPATFAVFRGGYNCRHEAIPVRVNEEQIAAGTLDV